MKRRFTPANATFTEVTRPPSGPRGQRRIGFVSSVSSDVYLSKPVPGMLLPACLHYADDAEASLDGWRVVDPSIRMGA
jgi:hypothetical protein